MEILWKICILHCTQQQEVREQVFQILQAVSTVLKHLGRCATLIQAKHEHDAISTYHSHVTKSTKKHRVLTNLDLSTLKESISVINDVIGPTRQTPQHSVIPSIDS